MTGERESSPLRAIATGTVVGALLCVSNLYGGLKVGWSTTMSITGALIAYALFQSRPRRLREATPFTARETALASSACNAAAAASSAGLVSAIPALTLMTGLQLPWEKLALWVLSVCLVGLVLAVPARRQMIVREPLRYPYGVAIAETVNQIYAHGSDAIAKVYALLAAGVVSGGLNVLQKLRIVARVGLPGSVGPYPVQSLTWSFEPSLFLVAIGGLMGFRACASVLLGAVLAFGVGAPVLLSRGLAKAGASGASWFPQLVTWLLWPGVTLMVVASLTSFVLSWRSKLQSPAPVDVARAAPIVEEGAVPSRWLWSVAGAAVALSIGTQIAFFAIPWWAAMLGLAISATLAFVAARTQGETGVTPIGAMGKITQLAAGVALPASAAVNLMTANVTGGAAALCGAALNDFKAGSILGVRPVIQWTAHLCGAIAGAMSASALYLVMVPDPATMLLTTEYPAPAVAAWKAVAEIFQRGGSGLPPYAGTASVVAAFVGVTLAALEAKASPAHRRWIPAPAALGLGFVVPANQALAIFVGGAMALGLERARPSGFKRLWIPICAGAIVGESLVAVASGLLELLRR